MKHLADEIAQIFEDYHSHADYTFSSEHVLRWIEQFENQDQQFILEEFLHLLRQGIYVSESKARTALIAGLMHISKKYGFSDLVSFLKNCDFLDVQPEGKSQSSLLKLLDQELTKQYDMQLADCGQISKKYAIYLDDLIATGNTVFEDLKLWLQNKNNDGVLNFDKVVTKVKILIVMTFGRSSLGQTNIEWRLKSAFAKDSIRQKIFYPFFYEIQNNPGEVNQRLNFAYPNVNQPKEVIDYLDNLNRTYKAEFAYRKVNAPLKETFFSSPENRIRFENILLLKGIELLNSANHLKDNHRPMGVINPTKKSLGSGTLFFTWRNISNTTPIVFWWKPHGSDWYPLFPLLNRGN